MSVHAVAWAFEQDLTPGGRKFVLVALADHANAQGRCYPSQARLAFMTGQDIVTVRRHLKSLEEMGYITRLETRRESDNGRTTDTIWLNAPPERLDPSYGASSDNEDRVPTKRPTHSHNGRPATPPVKMTRGVPPSQNDRGPQNKTTGAPRTKRPGKNHQLEPSGESSGLAHERSHHHHVEEESNQKILDRTFGRLLETLLDEQPARRSAWFNLTAEQTQAAHNSARDDVLSKSGTFATHFKTRLDEASGIRRSATNPEPLDAEEVRVRDERRAAANQIRTDTYDAALREGYESGDADELAWQAYYRALEAGNPNVHGQADPKTTAPAPLVMPDALDAAPDGLIRETLIVIGSHLPELTRKDPQRVKRWEKLTREEQEEALHNAQGSKKEQEDSEAYELRVMEALDDAAGNFSRGTDYNQPEHGKMIV